MNSLSAVRPATSPEPTPSPKQCSMWSWISDRCVAEGRQQGGGSRQCDALGDRFLVPDREVIAVTVEHGPIRTLAMRRQDGRDAIEFDQGAKLHLVPGQRTDRRPIGDHGLDPAKGLFSERGEDRLHGEVRRVRHVKRDATAGGGCAGDPIVRNFGLEREDIARAVGPEQFREPRKGDRSSFFPDPYPPGAGF